MNHADTATSPKELKIVKIVVNAEVMKFYQETSSLLTSAEAMEDTYETYLPGRIRE